MSSNAAQQSRWTLWGLAVLTSINLVNYLDRYLVSALAESLKTSELQLSDLQLGSLMTGFLFVYMISAPLFGMMGDRGSRPRWIAAGIVLWSVATVLSGMARQFVTLFVSRALVGIGEAAYVTIAPSLLADYFPRSRRGRAFAVFFCAIPVGSALGYIFGGLIEKHFGWRYAFFIGGLPGLVLSVLTLFLPDPKRGSGEDDDDVVSADARQIKKSMLATYKGFILNRPYALTVLGYAAYTFAVGGLAFWMPAFLERIRGVPRQSATVGFGAIVVVTGLLGTFAGGWLGDYLIKRWRQAYLWMSAWMTLLAVPFVCVALIAASPTWYYGAICIAELLLFASTGPINTAIVNFVSPLERASAIAFSMFAIHALGDVISPPLIGVVSDHSSLAVGVLLVPAAVLLCATFWFIAARTAERAV